MNTADVAAPMRPEATYFEASPLVVRAHAPATIAIRPLYDHVRFNDGPYQVRVIAAEGAGVAAGPAGGRPQSLLPAGDELRVTHEFGGEQEYVVLVQPEHGEGKPAVEFRVYALEEDLFGRRPYKGDLHLHSSYSDGRESPGYVAACCRRTGLDFMALTDHRQYAPSLEAIQAYAGLGCDLRMYPGEEVHPPDNPVHIVNFGGSASVNEQFATEAYRAGVAAVEQALVDLPPGMDPYPYASCVWCFDRIRRAGGLGIFCHPYWFCAHRYDVPEILTTLLLERQPFDALELIGGYHRHESESNVLQVARYHEERSRGRHLPIVGASDAHGCETGELFGWYYTVVFAPSVELADLIQGIKDLFSVAVEALPGETARAFGPFRLVKYSHFLLREVFPRHDALCREEGRLMLAHLAAEDGAAAGLRALGGRTEAMRQRLWDGPTGTGAAPPPMTSRWRGKQMSSTPSRPELALAGDWEVRVCPGQLTWAGRTVTVAAPVTLAIAPAVEVAVTAEHWPSLPLFAPTAAGWAKGRVLQGINTQETSARGMLDPASLRLAAAPGGEPYRLGEDYDADLEWGTFGRLPGSRIGEDQAVYAYYRYGASRLDAVVADAAGRVVVRPGMPHVAVPRAPALARGEVVIGHVWVPGRLGRLGPDALFPILEAEYPEPEPETPSPAERWLPRTVRRLRSGERLRLLAWGDSVTDAGYLARPQEERWQAQLVARLRVRFPRADLELVTEAWPGYNTASYLAEPPGSLHNYRDKVLGAQPDLVVSEFVNDAGLPAAQVAEQYPQVQADFAGIGAEWLILTPHYVRPDWMELTRERDIDEDPRPYVHFLRRFADRPGVALADAARRWGRLWRQGIPYTTLLLNAINHPDERGMRLFADGAMALFPPPPAT